MPIVPSDIQVRLSAPGAAAGNTTAGVAGSSLGKYVSSNTLVDATLGNLFPDITGDENAASNVDYQCLFIYNSHSTITYLGAVVWLASETAGGANAAVAVDNIAASALGSSSQQAAVIANKNTAPTGTTAFGSPTSKATGIPVGDLAPGNVRAIWVRRTATNSAAQNLDGVVLQVQGDTTA